jgi:hypothetical protein
VENEFNAFHGLTTGGKIADIAFDKAETVLCVVTNCDQRLVEIALVQKQSSWTRAERGIKFCAKIGQLNAFWALDRLSMRLMPPLDQAGNGGAIGMRITTGKRPAEVSRLS